nr:MAG TPA: hypothetical protein [Caudoviricetes sp.]
MFGGVDAFDAMVFGQAHPGTLNFLTQQYQQLTQSAANLVGQAKDLFLTTAQSAYDRYVSPEAQMRIRSMLGQVEDNTLHEVVRHMYQAEEMQQAGLVMQRWIMAEPTVRAMYLKQQLDGYADVYQNVHGEDIGDTHKDYRMVKDGILEFVYDEDGELAGYEVPHYMLEAELAEDEPQLEIDEQVDILSTWDAMKAIIKAGTVDPTSPVGGFL